MGVAAHIAAAAPGGPRFDRLQSTQERISAGNGIWLCQRCAKLIDSDLLRYPVSLLKRWKASAEHLASKDLSHGLFSLDGLPEPYTPIASALDEALTLPADLTVLLPSELSPEAKVAVLLEDVNSFGNRLAVIGVETNTDWRLFYFTRIESGWRGETEIDIPFQKYAPPAVSYIPGAPGALDIVHLTGSGTGILHASHSLYRVGRGSNKIILTFPQLFYVHGWGMPLRRELCLLNLQLPDALIDGAQLVLIYQLTYSAIDIPGDDVELLSELIERKLVWNGVLDTFEPSAPDDDFTLLDEIWMEDTEGFLHRNRKRLLELKEVGTPQQQAFVQAHLS